MNSSKEDKLIDYYPDTYNVSKLHLTKREKECISYLLYGFTSKQIARKLNISHRTVEYYIESIKNKFKCRTRFELIFKFIKMPTNIEYIR